MFHKTEVQANRLGGLILLCSGIVLLLILVLGILDIFSLKGRLLYSTTIRAIVEILLLLSAYKIVKNGAWWLEQLLLIVWCSSSRALTVYLKNML